MIRCGLGQEVACCFNDFDNIDWSNGNGNVDVQMYGLNSEEKPSFKMLELSFSSKFKIISFAKTVSKITGAFICSKKFLYICKSVIRPCMECYCHVWDGATEYCLKILDKLQKRACRTIVPSLAACLEPLAHCRKAVFSIGITLVDFHLNCPKWFHFLILVESLLVILTDCMIFCHHSQML